MKILIKNFYRSKFCNLTIKSIRHFNTIADIEVMNLYLNSPSEYEKQAKLDVPDNKIIYRKSNIDVGGNAEGNSRNGQIFSEGYNLVFDYFSWLNEKVLVLAEDCIFSNGETLKELYQNDWDVAYAPWGSGGNGSFLGFNPVKCKDYFPIQASETESIERVIQKNFMNRPNCYRITNRNEEDYRGDGIYSNNYYVLAAWLVKEGIINKDTIDWCEVTNKESNMWKKLNSKDSVIATPIWKNLGLL